MRGILCEGSTGLTTSGFSITGGRLIGGCGGLIDGCGRLIGGCGGLIVCCGRLIGGCGGMIVCCGGLIDGCCGKLTTGAGSRTGKASYFGSSSL